MSTTGADSERRPVRVALIVAGCDEADAFLQPLIEQTHDAIRDLGGAVFERRFPSLPLRDDGQFARRQRIADSTELTIRGHHLEAIVGCSSDPAGLFGIALAALRLDLPTVICSAGEARSTSTASAVVRAVGLGSSGSLEVAGVEVMRRVRRSTRPRSGLDRAVLDRAAAALHDNDHAIEMLVHLVALGIECGMPLDVVDLLATSSRMSAGSLPVAVMGRLARRGALAWDLPTARARWPVVVASDLQHARQVVVDGSATGRAIVVPGQGAVGAPGPGVLVDLADAVRASSLAPAAVVTDGIIARLGIPTFGIIDPEAAVGGALGLVRDGDVVEYVGGRLDVIEGDGVALDRRDRFLPAASRSEADRRYARFVRSSHEGAATRRTGDHASR